MDDPYKELWRMYQKKRALAEISREWTKWGLDMREGFFWAGPLTGHYVQRTWMFPRTGDNAAHFRRNRAPPLRCDRPEYVKAMVMHWARYTGELPQTLVIRPTTDAFGKPDGGFMVDPTSIRWDKIIAVPNWKFTKGELRKITDR